jgi:beta-glucanase (GH16 family)
MTRRRKLAIGVPIMAAIVLWGLGASSGTKFSASAASAVGSAPSGRVSVTAAAVAPPKAKLEFSATFSGSRLNTSIWDKCYPWMRQAGCTLFGNPEYEWYVPSQVAVSRGSLRLVAKRLRTVGRNATGQRKVYGCRSGVVTTFPGFHFTYGFVQVVADVPHAPGLWTGLWLAPANFSFPPEVDILESWGVRQESASFFHAVGGKKSRGLIPVKLTRGWQTYSLRWTKSRLTYYVGKKVVLTVTQRVPHQAMYFLADLAEYQKPARGNCNGQLLIKSVKIWK